MLSAALVVYNRYCTPPDKLQVAVSGFEAEAIALLDPRLAL